MNERKIKHKLNNVGAIKEKKLGLIYINAKYFMLGGQLLCPEIFKNQFHGCDDTAVLAPVQCFGDMVQCCCC